MDVRRNSEVDDTAAGLAERARQAMLSLYLRSAEVNGTEGVGGAVETCQVLASLKSLVENLVRILPELTAQLERDLLAGTLPLGAQGVTFDGLTRNMRDATAALARARNVGAQLGRDLDMAQMASRGLVSP
jgi:hypothetical protein